MGRKNTASRRRFIPPGPKGAARKPAPAGSCVCGAYVRDDANHCPGCHSTFRALTAFLSHRCPGMKATR